MKKTIFLFVFIISIVGIFASCGTSTKKSDSDSKLIGTWVSNEDSKYELEITTSEWIDTYEGKNTLKAKYILGDTCAVSITDKNIQSGKYITVFDNSEIYCYFIVSATDENLELSYVGRGNTLSFSKKK